METAETPSPGFPSDPVHKPTDSMVTVSLSDTMSNPEPVEANWAYLNSPRTPVEAASPVEITERSEEQYHSTPRSSQMMQTVRAEGSYVNSRDSNAGSGGEDGLSDQENDWESLDRTEEQEPRNGGSDESTALLLARLEQENDALATNPKSGLSRSPSAHRESRAKSLHHIQRLINEPTRSSLRYSQLPTPAMTELEFWAALVSDYPQTAQRLPTLTTNKIRAGVPPPLRGVVWPSLAGARDMHLLAEFQRLCNETSPYEGLIGKDIGRSFPNVEMFRDPNGEGQQMLARVLRSFSLHDTKIGYCQGLGFVVGPLLMHMTDAEAFCVLVRLMEQYALRDCYLPDLSGLHLRIYQFQNLLARHRPALFAHLESLHVEPIYVSQWFLSFFAVTCPLPMLLRIYDVIFLEGACETLMRVALSLMQRNEKKILACTEFEDAMQLLLSRSLWDTYTCHADDLVEDFVSLTSLVTKESLQALEMSYNQSQGVTAGISFPQMQAAASRFLGRLWAGSSHNSVRSSALNPGQSNASRPVSTIRRSTSKQSMTSTLNSVESASDASTAPTELSVSNDMQKPRAKSAMSHNKDRDLHTQIEDLLMALSDLQRQHADITRELQQEREEREEDQNAAKAMLEYIKGLEDPPTDLLAKAEDRFGTLRSKRTSIIQTKHQLRDDVNKLKEMRDVEAARCLGLTRQLDEREQDNARLRDQLREARTRIQDGYRDRQRLERTILDLRAIKTPSDSPPDITYSPSSEDSYTSSGLRELKLVRTNSQNSISSGHNTARGSFNKRTSSLGLQSVLATENNKPAAEESLLLELVHSKTAEAVAKQELEEVKAKLDALRKLVSGSGKGSPLLQGRNSLNLSASIPNGLSKASTEPAGSSSGGGGFFSGWGRRAASTSGDSYSDTK
ncbi:hypothetical protein ASPZODRAFT_13797 [Penicilliopsis zonata CBS 506.65]|uniref:Rab-GAP TBC domain-containing protein n=1 Tax=Penicilliopsis zonata CBS 506.65 TaxID=1073090 RepID=A0A1L9SPE1_9EURO|nr:hypothetical protein ASPZODRAFT_13797 [Penicilliopsis zonata CBS 506.65]OJJ49060.1 hypothetical protein ASPZODRAFT_13797 [Penicilliopsis zonata CBS 506.65]